MASLGERMRVAAKALVGVFSEASAREAFGMLAGIFPGAVGAPPTRGARERVGAYADMPWLHAVADKVASAFAAVEWRLLAVRPSGAARAIQVKALQRLGGDYQALQARHGWLGRLKQAGELIPVESHPCLDLLVGGNSFMTGLAMRKVTALHMDLEGETFWLKERSGLGVPTGAWPLPPDWVAATPTPTNRFFRVSFRGWQGQIPDTEMLWFVNHNPSNPYARGAGLGRALADELETDEYAAKYMRQVFLNQNRPDFLVYPKAPATWNEPERLRLQHEWRSQHEGFWRAVKARFASREVGIHEFGETNFRQLQMVQLREFERDLIVQVWGVPPEILGIIREGNNRATITMAAYLFARWVLVPRLEAFRAALQERLVPEYDARLVLDYVSPVEKDREFHLEVGRVAPWSLSVDEWRALGELDPLADGRGADLYPQPLGMLFGDLGDGTGGLAMGGMDLAGLKADELLALRRLQARSR